MHIPTKRLIGWAVAIALHLFWVGSVVSETQLPLFYDSYNLETSYQGKDFKSVVHGGYTVANGATPYTLDVLEEEPFRQHTENETAEFTVFRYPPFAAQTLGWAFTKVHPDTGYWLWLVIIELALLIGLLISRRFIESPRTKDMVSWLWLGTPLVYLELFMGQFTLVTAVMVLAGIWLIYEKGFTKAGLALWATASAIKMYPALLLVVFLRNPKLRWQALGIGAVGGVLSVAWFIWHPEAARQFISMNFGGTGIRMFHAGHHGLQSFVYLCFGDPGTGLSAAQWKPIASVMTICLAGLWTGTTLFGKQVDARIPLAGGLLLLPLVSKHVWEGHYFATLPAIALLASLWYNDRQKLKYLAVLAVMMLGPSLLGFLQAPKPGVQLVNVGWSRTMELLYHGQKPLAALALLFWCVKQQSFGTLRVPRRLAWPRPTTPIYIPHPGGVGGPQMPAVQAPER